MCSGWGDLLVSSGVLQRGVRPGVINPACCIRDAELPSPRMAWCPTHAERLPTDSAPHGRKARRAAYRRKGCEHATLQHALGEFCAQPMLQLLEATRIQR